MKPSRRRFEKLLTKLKNMLPVLRTDYKVRTLEVFGSFLRGEEQKGSDLDLLVTFDEVPTLFQFIALENYLSDELGVKVDLVMKDSSKTVDWETYPGRGTAIMSGHRVYLDYVRDMLNSAEKAIEFVEGMEFEQFSRDEKTTYAVVRALEIVGEAAKKIPVDLRQRYSENSLARHCQHKRQTDSRILWRESVGSVAINKGRSTNIDHTITESGR